MRKLLILGDDGRIGSVLKKEAYGDYEVFGFDLLSGYDLTKRSHMEKALNYSKPDCIVNCTYPPSFLDHIRIAYNAIIYGVTSMMDRGNRNWYFNGGRIINIASIYGIVGQKPEMYHETGVEQASLFYNAAKGATIAMTKGAAQYAENGISVNCVSPGGILTEDMPQRFVTAYNRRNPARQMCSEIDVVNAILFLLKPESGYIVGHNLVVDGGFTAW